MPSYRGDVTQLTLTCVPALVAVATTAGAGGRVRSSL
jgi:hypothetical protein